MIKKTDGANCIAFFKENQIIQFEYKNWRGNVAVRKVKVISFVYGSTEWHPEPQWLLEAHDFDRDDVRLFAVCDIVPIKTA